MTDRIVSRATCTLLGNEIEAAIDPIFAKHGFERGKTTRNYGEFFGIKIQATPIGAPKPAENDFTRYASLFDLPADALGKQVRLGSRLFTITGLNTRAPKNPVMLKGDDGKSYKAPAESVKRGLVLA